MEKYISISGEMPLHGNKNDCQRSLFSRDDLKRMGIRVSNTSLLRWEALGRFPRRTRMAGCSVAWLADEVTQWLETRASERANHVYADAKF